MMLTLLLFACGSTPPHAVEPARAQAPVIEAPAAEPSEYFPGIPAYPGARFLCSQQVMARIAELSYRTYTSEDDIAKIREFYERQGVAIEPGDGFFDMRASGEAAVSVHPMDDQRPTCDVEPGPHDRSYFVVSSMLR